MSKSKSESPVQVIGNWKVMPDGTLKGDYANPAGMVSEITLSPEKLLDESLLFKMHVYQAVARTEWCDFIAALFAAYSILGLDRVTIRTTRA